MNKHHQLDLWSDGHSLFLMNHCCHQIWIKNKKSIVEHRSCYSRVASKQQFLLELKKDKSIVRFFGVCAFVLSSSELMKCSSYIITCNCYCLRPNPFFISRGIYILYIFPRKLSKNCKKIPKISCFCGKYKRVSAISLTWDIALINKPHVVNNFSLFLKQLMNIATMHFFLDIK